MKVKACAIFLISVLFFIFPVSLFAQQSDLYGSWELNSNDYEDLSEYGYSSIWKITFSASAVSLKIEEYSYNELVNIDEREFQIIKWQAIDNSEGTIRAAFPNGFYLTYITSFGYEEGLEVFISANKQQIIVPEMNEGYDKLVVFIKQ
ncbi:MAG: hypothetical protein FWD28_05160 [Treponema sp.]|nr:hypothetical protein [Treponema sp.]